MQQSLSRRTLWHPALPYALDYLALVTATAFVSMFWFTKKLHSLYLAVPLGMAFTILAGMVYYRWQHGRWLHRKLYLEQTALRLWLENHFLEGTLEDFRAMVLRLLTAQEGFSVTKPGKNPLITRQNQAHRLICLRRHPSCPADAQLLVQLREAFPDIKLIAASSASFTESAQDYAKRADIRLLAVDELSRMVYQSGMRLPKDTKSRYIRKAYLQTRQQRRSLWARIRQSRSLRYLAGSILLILMGLFSPWRGWYWMSALYCSITGAARWIASTKRREDRF